MRLLLVLVLVLSACGGGGGASSQDDETGQPAGAQATPGQTAGGQATQAATPTAGSDGAPVSEMTAKRRQATFKVAYRWTGSGAPTSETWYSKPPKFRVDLGDASQTQVLSLFVLPDGSFTCETVDGKPTCWKSPVQFSTIEELSFAAAVMVAYEGFLKDPSVKATRATRTIAGQQASCFTSSNLIALGLFDVTLCHSSSGVPLFFQWKVGNDTLTMEATSYSGGVADKDVELLATPQSY